MKGNGVAYREWWIGVAAAACLGAVTAAGSAPPATPAPTAAGLELFEKRVRPLLHTKCVSCHSGPRAQGGLDLKTRAGAFRGGALGPALVPGDLNRSPLIRAVRGSASLKMPPTGPLPVPEVELLEEWVRMGAPWPEDAGRAAASAAPGTARTGEAASDDPAWAFQPVRSPAAPVLSDDRWSRTPIDRFLLARQRSAGLEPNPPADRHTLLRRITFDLTGLPPTAEEIQAFVSDLAPNAWEKVVDRLLASPAYGERWGRHWLDVARYADSNGRDWNEVFPNAWRYRDWVIRAFNQDLPYNQFVREQVAGDLLPASSGAEYYDHLIASGFLVMGPKLLGQQDRVQLALDIVDEQLDVTGKAFLGLTLGCARCHDHKFDPISARDYYALAGIFNSTRTLGNTLPRNDRVMYWMERPLAPDGVIRTWVAHREAVRRIQDASKRATTPAEKDRFAAEIKTLESQAPPDLPLAMAVAESAETNGDMRVHLRGSYQQLGEVAPRGIPTIFGSQAQFRVPTGTSGRLELADWIASPDNPLTARVLVNRVWRHHFGRGLVETPDNFGAQGERPTHPELLDWLARVFVTPTAETRDGVAGLNWSVKGLHRLILLSQAYQMSSTANPTGIAKDGENRLVWRMNRRRLEAEALRDSMLMASGVLDRNAGGTLLTKSSGFPIREFPVDFQVTRRSVYLPVLRNGMYDFFQSFDFADPNIVTGRRNVTTVSTQSLVMLNSPWVRSQAALFARRLAEQAGSDEERIAAAFRHAYGRDASAGDVARARAFVEQTNRELAGGKSAAEARQEAWKLFCQALYASSEFRYVD